MCDSTDCCCNDLCCNDSCCSSCFYGGNSKKHNVEWAIFIIFVVVIVSIVGAGIVYLCLHYLECNGTQLPTLAPTETNITTIPPTRHKETLVKTLSRIKDCDNFHFLVLFVIIIIIMLCLLVLCIYHCCMPKLTNADACDARPHCDESQYVPKQKEMIATQV